jgi:hydroxyacid-oxoacid transhydrogenase
MVGHRNSSGCVPVYLRFTYSSNPERHWKVAEMLFGEEIKDADENTLPEIIQLVKDVSAPRGLREIGYDEEDIDQLVDGVIKQERLLVLSPREVTEEDLANILCESMENW